MIISYRMRTRKHMSSSHYNVNWNNHYHKNNSDHWKKHFLQSHSWNPSWQVCTKKWQTLYQLNFNYTFPVRLCKFALMVEHKYAQLMMQNLQQSHHYLQQIWTPEILGKFRFEFSWTWMFNNVLMESLVSVCTPIQCIPPTFILKEIFSLISSCHTMCKLQLSHWMWVNQKAEGEWWLTSSELEQEDLKWPRKRKLTVISIIG